MNPFGSLRRVLKYTRKGYFMPDEQLANLMECWKDGGGVIGAASFSGPDFDLLGELDG